MKQNEKLRKEAWFYQKNGKAQEAENIYRLLINDRPDPRDIGNLGALLQSTGKIKEALELYQCWINKMDRSRTITLNAVNCAIEARDFKKAEKWIREEEKHTNYDKDLEQAKARFWEAQDKLQEAIHILERLNEKEDSNIKIKFNLGMALYKNGDPGKALKIYTQIHQIEPFNPDNISNMITLLQEENLQGQAEVFIKEISVELKNNSKIRAAIAFYQLRENRMEEAEMEFAKLCLDEPRDPRHWLNHCATLRALKRSNKAYQVAQKGYILHAQYNNLRYALSQCYAEIGKVKQAARLIQPEIDKELTKTDNLMYNIQYLGEGYRVIDSEKLKMIAHQWEDKKLNQGIREMWRDRIQDKRKGRKIRIGYLSVDFCNHPVGRFIRPILKQHNQKQFKIFIISCGKIHDHVTSELKQLGHEWVEIKTNDDLRTARIISELKLDIIIELGGYTSGSRIGSLCHRPVPIQMSYLGYFAPTYLKCIDYWIGDNKLFSKLSKTQLKAHKLVYLKGGYMGYEDDETPRLERINEVDFRFGCFNHSRKLSIETIQLFCQVMEANPKAKLVLKSISFVEKQESERVKKALIEEGLSKQRIEILPWIKGRKNHLGCYKYMDVALDPVPYGGATTTCEALSMGVPVITLSGEGMVGQLSSSILVHCGCDEWIANDDNDYIEISQKLYREGIREENTRIKLKKKVLSSQLGDCTRLTRELEKLYVTVA